MKRCPNCNRTFEEDWLAFCTQDGTTLIDESPAKKDDLQATMLAPSPPPPAGGWQTPSGLRAVSVTAAGTAPPPSGDRCGPVSAGAVHAGLATAPPPPYAVDQSRTRGRVHDCASSRHVGCAVIWDTLHSVCLGLGIYQLVQIRTSRRNRRSRLPSSGW